MYVVLDDNNYVKFLSMTTPMVGSIEIENEELDLNLLKCYKINDSHTALLLDAKKVEEERDRIRVASTVADLKKELAESDFRVLGRLREQALGIVPHLSETEYLKLEAKRESCVRRIRELEDEKSLTTDVDEILNEGHKKRESQKVYNKEVTEAVNSTIPELKVEIEKISVLREDIDKISQSLQNEIAPDSAEPDKKETVLTTEETAEEAIKEETNVSDEKVVEETTNTKKKTEKTTTE